MKAILIATTLCCSVAVQADSAVESVHFQLGLDTGRIDFPGADIRDYSVSAGITVPLAKYFGASLAGRYGKLDIDDSIGSCEPEYGVLGAGLFARDSGIGRIGASYSRVRDEACIFSAEGDWTETVKRDLYSVHAEYYLRAVTLELVRGWYDFHDGSEADSAFVTASWYPTTNLALRFVVGALDADDNYVAQLEYQPAFFGNSLGLRLAYSYTDVEPKIDAVMVGFNYYFDKRMDLQTRDRRYR